MPFSWLGNTRKVHPAPERARAPVTGNSAGLNARARYQRYATARNRAAMTAAAAAAPANNRAEASARQRAHAARLGRNQSLGNQLRRRLGKEAHNRATVNAMKRNLPAGSNLFSQLAKSGAAPNAAKNAELVRQYIADTAKAEEKFQRRRFQSPSYALNAQPVAGGITFGDYKKLKGMQKVEFLNALMKSSDDTGDDLEWLVWLQKKDRGE